MVKISSFLFIFLFAFRSENLFSQSKINVGEIQSILMQDQLDAEKAKKKQKATELKRQKKKRLIERFKVPYEHEMWGILSESWLVRNAPDLQWDFKRPDYGLAFELKTLFERMGLYEIPLKVLVLNSHLLPHLALPSYGKETIFLISLPFMRSMDLTQLEIAILFLEDYQRLKSGHFKEAVLPKSERKKLGGNFYKKKKKFPQMGRMNKNYSDFIFKKGFSFKQQFDVTQKMASLLRPHSKLFRAYLTLIRKKNQLVKTNPLYENHNRLYPSPEMQLKWLSL